MGRTKQTGRKHNGERRAQANGTRKKDPPSSGSGMGARKAERRAEDRKRALKRKQERAEKAGDVDLSSLSKAQKKSRRKTIKQLIANQKFSRVEAEREWKRMYLLKRAKTGDKVESSAVVAGKRKAPSDAIENVKAPLRKKMRTASRNIAAIRDLAELGMGGGPDTPIDLSIEKDIKEGKNATPSHNRSPSPASDASQESVDVDAASPAKQPVFPKSPYMDLFLNEATVVSNGLPGGAYAIS